MIIQSNGQPAPESSRQLDKGITAEPQTSAVNEATPTEEQKLSPKFAMLAKREKALRSEAQRLKAERAEWEAQKSSNQAGLVPKDKLAQQLRSDPLGFFTEAGMTADEVANLLLNQRPEDAAYRKLQLELQQTRE